MRTHLRFLILPLLLALGATTVFAANGTAKRQVLRPDGQPAAKAVVTIRRFTGLGERELKLESETVFMADLQGRVEIPLQDQENWNSLLVIDAPGFALALAPLFERDGHHRGGVIDPFLPIQLVENTPIRGRVVDAEGAAVAGAQVVLAGIRINWVAAGVSTPQLMARSAADGTFSLRGVSFSLFMNQQSLNVHAFLRDGEKLVAAGWESIRFKTRFPEKVTPLEKEVLIVLRPTITVRGQVVNDISHQPVAGATVTLSPNNFYLPLSPIVTGDEGRFEWNGVPVLPSAGGSFDGSEPLRISAAHAILPPMMASLHKFIKFEEVRSLYQISLAMRPLATLSGRVIDVETGQPPLWPPLLQGFRQEGTAAYAPSGNAAWAQVAPKTGDFALALTAGPNHLVFDGPGFYDLEAVIFQGRNILEREKIDPLRGEINLPPQGASEVLIEARKRPGIWIHLDTDDVSTKGGGLTFTLHTREKINGTTEHSLRREWTFLPTKNWGDAIEARVMNYQKEVLPWTKLVADPQRRPIVVSIPTKTAEPARIGIELPLRSSKYSFN